MDRKTILWALAGVAAIAAIVLSLMFGGADTPKPEETPKPLPTIDVGGGPSGTPSTGTPTPEPVKDELDQSEYVWPGEGLPAFAELGVAVVREYATFNTSETAEDRTARIAAVAGDTVASGVTGLSLPRYKDTVDFTAKTGLTGSPYGSPHSVDDPAGTYTVKVFSQYWGSYGTPETQSQQSQGTWTVVIKYVYGADGAPVPDGVLSVTEPEFQLE